MRTRELTRGLGMLAVSAIRVLLTLVEHIRRKAVPSLTQVMDLFIHLISLPFQ